MGGDQSASPPQWLDTTLLDPQARRDLISLVDSKVGIKQQADARVTLTPAEVEAVIGTASFKRLVSVFCADGAGPCDKIKARRVVASGASWVPFHTDHANRVMQIPLNDESEYEGGRLVFATEANGEHTATAQIQTRIRAYTMYVPTPPLGFFVPSRRPGSATIHTRGVVRAPRCCHLLQTLAT